jgi:hypothetical protein
LIRKSLKMCNVDVPPGTGLGNTDLNSSVSVVLLSVIITRSITHYNPTSLCVSTEALKQTNMSMKERFEGLSAWKETQKEERGFLEKRLEEAKTKLNTMDAENEMLKKRVEELEKSGAEVSEARITQPRSI